MHRLFWLILALAVGRVEAATAWDESTHGDLSGDGLAPTTLLFFDGHNEVVGTTGNDGLGVDRDYFSFTVATGSVLRALNLLGNTSVSGSASFIGMQAGPQITVSPSGAGAEALLGFAHYGSDQIGTDMLPSIVFGYQGVLPAGTYSVWVQETGGPVTYGFDFVTSAVPEPGAAALLVAGLLGIGVLRRR